jgi:hypothetical protein
VKQEEDQILQVDHLVVPTKVAVDEVALVAVVALVVEEEAVEKEVEEDVILLIKMLHPMWRLSTHQKEETVVEKRRNIITKQKQQQLHRRRMLPRNQTTTILLEGVAVEDVEAVVVEDAVGQPEEAAKAAKDVVVESLGNAVVEVEEKEGEDAVEAARTVQHLVLRRMKRKTPLQLQRIIRQRNKRIRNKQLSLHRVLLRGKKTNKLPMPPSMIALWQPRKRNCHCRHLPGMWGEEEVHQ